MKTVCALGLLAAVNAESCLPGYGPTLPVLPQLQAVTSALDQDIC
eukprot:SAG11_NODE_24653_length_370_cov_0.704797_1_plen_44_part_10